MADYRSEWQTRSHSKRADSLVGACRNHLLDGGRRHQRGSIIPRRQQPRHCKPLPNLSTSRLQYRENLC